MSSLTKPTFRQFRRARQERLFPAPEVTMRQFVLNRLEGLAERNKARQEHRRRKRELWIKARAGKRRLPQQGSLL